MKKRKIVLSIIAIAIALLSLLGVSYAYYKANVKNINQTQTVIKANELGLIYTGISEITADDMIPGDSFTKTFSVENTSNVAVSYNIYMESITNEFNEDLVYTLSDENGVVIEERELPKTNKGKKYLKTYINIAVKEKQNYTLKIEYKYLNTAQNTNQGAIFSATVGIDVEEVKGTLMKAINSDYNLDFFWKYKNNITKVVFENKLSTKQNAAYTFDVSEDQNKSVMSYLVANEENPSTYTLYLQANGKIAANEDSSYLFYKFTNLTTIEGLEYLDTSNVTNMAAMFYDCSSLTNLDLTNFDTSNVTSMYAMFGNNSFTGKHSSLKSIDVSHFDTSKVTSMDAMFDGCNNLTTIVGLKNFDTSKVTSMQGMFANCSSLANLDVSTFDTSNVTNMAAMFKGCSSLTNLNVSNFDTSNVTSMGAASGAGTTISVDIGGMFQGCSSLTSLDLSGFNTSKVISMYAMFYNCNSLTSLDISNFDTSNVKYMYSMFENMPSNTLVKVRNQDMQTWVLNLSSMDRPYSWTSSNVVFNNKCNVDSNRVYSGGPYVGYKIYYSERVSFSNGIYTLINPQLFTVGSDTTTLIGKYSTFNANYTTNSGNIYYITELKSDGAISEYNVAINGECAT